MEMDYELMFKALMQNIPDSVYYKVYDGEKFVFVYVNEAKAARSGKEMLGKTDSDFMTPKDAMRSFNTDMLAYNGNIIHDDIEETIRPDGSITWSSATKAPLKDPSGNTFGIVGISRDITQRMEEQEKNNKIEKLMRTEVRAILHKLKNIITGHGGFMGRMISLLKKGSVKQCLGLLPSRISECLSYEEQIKTMLLRIAQLGTDKPELPETESIFDLGVLFKKLIDRHSPRMNELNIRLDDFMGLIPEGKYQIKTIMNWLAFAIDCAIDNEIKYGEVITRLTFGAEIDQEQQQLVINVSSDGKKMDEEFARTRLFQIGQRAKDTCHLEGTGFGLYTAREYIRELGGDMYYMPVVVDEPEWMGFFIVVPLSILQNDPS